MLHELTGSEAGLLYLLFPHLSGWTSIAWRTWTAA